MFARFFLLVLFPLHLIAKVCLPCDDQKNWTLELRGAYYHPSSKQIRKIYTDHWLDYQVEVARRIHPFWEIWGGVYWACKEGHTKKKFFSYFEDKFRIHTQMYVVPLNLGIKLIYPLFPCVDVYAGAGVCYSFLRIKNFCKDHYSYFRFSRTPFKKEIHKRNVGAVLKIGFQIALSDVCFLDFFADYFFQRFHFSHHKERPHREIFNHDLDCHGYKLGVGFGVYF